MKKQPYVPMHTGRKLYQMGYNDALNQAIKELPDEMSCEEPGYETSEDSLLAADQSYNHAIRKIKALLEQMIFKK